MISIEFYYLPFEATTTTSIFFHLWKCAVYQDMYIQTWHPTRQASPPVQSCLATPGNFELVKNKYVRFTIRSAGSVIDELTLILFDETSNNAICTISDQGQGVGWIDCEENGKKQLTTTIINVFACIGIKPSLIKTATHETLTVYYVKVNFTTIVTRD
ncbi:unnamed protein product, partial [Rotaria sp. Silwood2]